MRQVNMAALWIRRDYSPADLRQRGSLAIWLLDQKQEGMLRMTQPSLPTHMRFLILRQ